MSNIELNRINGCFLISRSIFDSNIWYKPDWYFKLWIYFIGKANHSDNGQFKRGELFLAGGYKELQLVLMKRGGYGKKTYEKYEISKAIMYMTSEGFIATRKTTKGMYIIINNYNDYQTLQNYEKQQEKQMKSNSKATLVQQSSSTINNNEKNDKELNNKSITSKEVSNAEIKSRNLELVKYYEEKIDSKLQGSSVDNWRYCTHICNRLQKQYPDKDILQSVKVLIDLGIKDGFHQKNMNGFRYLFNNYLSIIKSYQQDRRTVAII